MASTTNYNQLAVAEWCIPRCRLPLAPCIHKRKICFVFFGFMIGAQINTLWLHTLALSRSLTTEGNEFHSSLYLRAVNNNVEHNFTCNRGSGFRVERGWHRARVCMCVFVCRTHVPFHIFRYFDCSVDVRILLNACQCPFSLSFFLCAMCVTWTILGLIREKERRSQSTSLLLAMQFTLNLNI